MTQGFGLVLVLAGLLAVVVGAGGKEGKLGNWLFPGPLTLVRQRIVIAVGVVAVLLGTVSSIYQMASSSNAEPPPAATGANDVPSGAPQTGAGQQPNPAPGAPEVLREGDASLLFGHALDMETGQFGQGVGQHDVSLSGSVSLRKLVPSQGNIAEIGSGAKPGSCAERLKKADAYQIIDSGEVNCLRTSAQHLAAVQVVVVGAAADEPTLLHYIVWNVEG